MGPCSALGALAGPAVVIVTPTIAAVGAAITIITIASRHFERKLVEIPLGHALKRVDAGKKINKFANYFGEKVPHLLFKELSCSELGAKG